MKLADFNKLRKLMQLTQSDNDAEALSAMRKANKILAAQVPPVDWDRVFNKLVTVDVPIEAADDSDRNDADKGYEQRVDEAFEKVLPNAKDGFREFVLSLQEQWERNKRLSIKQYDSLMRAANNAGARR